ncbi:complement component 1 Q subcomponent-binding protein, mitochondrial [Athalia rosae]|uniref:complement component 1 Q subcomponent-binding protein, mitochondrial n=1 Tax=Athalia rosae TaxID=37344 RepID=UPI000626BEBD|nr:complement component 1 Q subcomponent-binding protein, mitochondrial [Athalia rosae]
MNGIVRNALRVSAFKGFTQSAVSGRVARREFTRPMWNMCNRRKDITPLASYKLQNPIEFCSCGCNRRVHTKAEKELVQFLAEEIVAEKKAQKMKTIPTELDGFKISLDGAEVSLTKKIGEESISINFNVNHTVDSESEPDIDPQDDKQEFGEMKSKPNFEIDVVRGNHTLGFTCSFNNEPQASGADDGYNDIFGIDEITLYEGEHSEKIYAVAGDVVDGYLYDLLMNYLEEKGISNEFAEKLIELSTVYEHTAYISLLEGLSKFTSGK